MKKAYFLLLAGVLTAMVMGCAAPIKSSKEDLAQLSVNEGIVVGVFNIVTEKATEEQKKNAGIWKPQVTENALFTFSFTEDNDTAAKLLGGGFQQVVKPNKLEYFVKKLPAGNYSFRDMTLPGVLLPFPEKFTVVAGKTHYIGQFNLVLPVNVLPKTTFLRFRDIQIEQARKEIASEFPKVAQEMTMSPNLPTNRPVNSSSPNP